MAYLTILIFYHFVVFYFLLLSFQCLISKRLASVRQPS